MDVQRQRHYNVDWRFISLRILNEDQAGEWYNPDYRAAHYRGHQDLRVADAIRLGEGGGTGLSGSDLAGPVGRWYTAIGTALHVDRRRDEAMADNVGFIRSVLAEAGFDEAYADAADDVRHDSFLREQTELALSRTGRDVGTPILTFEPGGELEASLFGPVISKSPRGPGAVELWDAIVTVARSGVAELKRSNREKPDFT